MKYANRFLEKYKYLSTTARDEVATEYDGCFLTWKPIMVEVARETELGEELLEQLVTEGKL